MADEYIRREDAVNTVIPAMVDGADAEIVEGLIYMIEPADVVQVVRCKDCKFYTSMRPDIKTGICDLNVHHMGDDGFCSCGERREE